MNINTGYEYSPREKIKLLKWWWYVGVGFAIAGFTGDVPMRSIFYAFGISYGVQTIWDSLIGTRYTRPMEGGWFPLWELVLGGFALWATIKFVPVMPVGEMGRYISWWQAIALFSLVFVADYVTTDLRKKHSVGCLLQIVAAIIALFVIFGWAGGIEFVTDTASMNFDWITIEHIGE